MAAAAAAVGGLHVGPLAASPLRGRRESTAAAAASKWGRLKGAHPGARAIAEAPTAVLAGDVNALEDVAGRLFLPGGQARKPLSPPALTPQRTLAAVAPVVERSGGPSPVPPRSTKVTVVGVGNVGMACAQTILTNDLVDEIALVDVQADKLRGEMLDLQHAAAFLPSVRIQASTDYAVTADSDLCIVTAGARQREGESRLSLHSPNTVLLIVSNPVDVLTWASWKISGLPSSRVIGSGTNLDSSRFRFLIASSLNVNAQNVHAYIMGEHGDSSLPCWSGVNVGGVPLLNFLECQGLAFGPDVLEDIHKKVVDNAYEVIKLKGYTNWGIGYSTARLASSLLRNQRRIHPVSVLAQGFQGIEDEVYLSLPSLLGRQGVINIVNTNLTEQEAKRLRECAKGLADIQHEHARGAVVEATALHASDANGHHHHHDELHNEQHQDDHDHGHHRHSHHGNSGKADLNGLQRSIMAVARALRWAALADILRESMRASMVSFALLLVASAAPYGFGSVLAARIQGVLMALAFPLTAVPAVLDALVDLAGGQVNIHVLMALAAVASACMGNALEGGLLLAMFSISHSAEDIITERALGDVSNLKENNPETALLLESYSPTLSPERMSYKEVPVQKVAIGSFVLVKVGETVPVDGEVCRGCSMVVVEHLTGESRPQQKQVGDPIPGGARNVDGLLVIKAVKTWEDSTVARIMKLTREARGNRPRLQRWLDTFSNQYSQAVVIVSIAVAVLGPLLFKWPIRNVGGAHTLSLTGHALINSFCIAVTRSSEKGILLKGGQALDALAMCDSVAFDKTGTLTSGQLTCTLIEPLMGHTSHMDTKGQTSGARDARRCCTPEGCEMEALAIANAMEQAATHPIARAVKDYSQGRKLPNVDVTDIRLVPGQGLVAAVTLSEHTARKHVVEARLGSLDYIASDTPSRAGSERLWQAASASPRTSELVHAALAVGEKVTLFHFEDELREGTKEVIQELRDAKMSVLMLTGDHSTAAKRVGDAIGIEEVYSNLKPDDKLRHIQEWSKEAAKRRTGGLMMVGDGINDAPALAAASVGVVLARHASATAIGAADVLLLRDDLDGVAFVVAKARQTAALVKQSVGLALACIIVASFPAVLGFLPLWLTVLLHEGGTIIVCLNSLNLRLLRTNRSWAYMDMARLTLQAKLLLIF
eukprot:SM000104S09363  [mRNA]  locus=s104:324637:335005:+ [translate_table: standard]